MLGVAKEGYWELLEILCSRKSTKILDCKENELGNVRMWLETVVNSDKLSVRLLVTMSSTVS